LKNKHNLMEFSHAAYTWGRGDLGQLGLGTDSNAEVPTLVAALADKNVVHVAAAEYHTAFLTCKDTPPQPIPD
jgi:alpha-tubulin suppressor-like RCC1 family protein